MGPKTWFAFVRCKFQASFRVADTRFPFIAFQRIRGQCRMTFQVRWVSPDSLRE